MSFSRAARFLALAAALLPGLLHAQINLPLLGVGGSSGGSAAIVLDAAVTPCVTENTGGTATQTVTCALTSITSGDALFCFPEIYQTSNTVTYGKITDSLNGAVFNVANYFESGSSSLNSGAQGIAYLENSASGSDTITMTMNTSGQFMSLSCAAYKNVRTSASLDGGSINEVSTPNSTGINPTTGTAQTPGASNEMVLCVMQNSGAGNTPTAGSGYALVATESGNFQFPEYLVQTTAASTNCPYTQVSDTWTDLMTAFIPSSGSAGTIPLTGYFITFEGLTNAVAPTAAALKASTFGLPVNVNPWGTCSDSHSSLTGATAGQLHNLLSNVFTNGASYSGSGSLGIQYATGTGGDSCLITFPASFPSVSVAFWWETDVPNNDTNGNQYDLASIGSSGDECAMYISPSGSILRLFVEHGGGGSVSSITVSSSTVYQFQIQYVNAGNCTIRVFDVTGTEVSGSPISVAMTGATNATNLQIGVGGGETETSGKHIWWDDVQISFQGTFPLGH